MDPRYPSSSELDAYWKQALLHYHSLEQLLPGSILDSAPGWQCPARLPYSDSSGESPR